MTCLEDAIRPAALKAAWLKVGKGKLSKPGALRQGSDGHSLQSFAARSDDEIERIALRLRAGTFRFSPLQPYFVPKPNGKMRVICAPTVADRIVQRSVLDVLAKRQKWLQNPVSYGFVSERGVELAARQAIRYRKEKPWVFKTDITKFFDCVDRPILRAKVKQHIRQHSLHPILNAAIDCELKVDGEAQTKKLAKLGIHEGRGVRQGMPLSPFFANLFLASFDRSCVQRGVAALRYADDLIFFAGTKAEAEALNDFCAEELSKIQLGIPDLSIGSKTQIYAPDEAAEFLGVELAPMGAGDYQVRIGEAQLEAIKSAIYELSSLSELRRRQLDVTRFGNSLASRSAAYVAAYYFCSNSDQLATRLLDWAKAVRIKIAAALGIDLASLSGDARWFLGVD